VCCSFLVPSRSQSQLDRTPSVLQGTVTRSALISQLSTPFFVAVLVVSKGTILQLLTYARATLFRCRTLMHPSLLQPVARMTP
jgi:hypothetical protein